MSEPFKLGIKDKISMYSKNTVQEQIKGIKGMSLDEKDIEFDKEPLTADVDGTKKVTKDGEVKPSSANRIFDERVAYTKHLFDNNGIDPQGYSISLRDALSTYDASILLPQTIISMMLEAQEPLLVGSSLFDVQAWKPGQIVYQPMAISAIGGIKRMAPGEEYPEVSMEMADSFFQQSVGKVGLALKVTEELINESQFDVIGMTIRAIGRAFARHKETEIFQFISSISTPVFDNINARFNATTGLGSIFGSTTGRDLEGSANGSMTMDDLMDGYTHLLSKGFMPNTLLMHPLTWHMFMKDPIMRQMMLNSGGGTYFALWNGDFGNRSMTGAMGNGLGFSKGQPVNPHASPLEAYSQVLNSSPRIPSYFPFPLRIIVSPFVPMDPINELTDVYLFEAGEIGTILQEEALTTERWNDPERDIQKIKFRERYNFGIKNEGQASVVFKSIKVVANEIVLPAQSTISVGAGEPVQKLDQSLPVVQ